MLTYRGDLDGLRAVAVLGVVFFHLDLLAFSGGFVGVDVFFVISGYLITSIIYSKIVVGKFSILEFYDRRIRRILPAYFLMCGLLSLVAFFMLLPDDLESFGKSLKYTSIFWVNFLFARKVDYFDVSSESSPLLHMWSLSVEEQFYIFWPLILWGICKVMRKSYIKYFVVALVVISLFLSEYLAHSHPQIAFFLLPSRAWELGMGALLALNVFPSIRNRWANEALYFSGLILIFASFFFLSSASIFPGVNALWPCLGAFLVIYSGVSCDTYVSRLLRLKPMTMIGLISYSLYIWHWPIIALFKYTEQEFSLMSKGWLFCVSVIIAYLSWRYIETPFRIRNKHEASSKMPKSILWAIVFTVLFFVLALVFQKTDGLKWRVAHTVDIEEVKARHPLSYKCNVSNKQMKKDNGALPEYQNCAAGAKGEDYNVVLFGDSHADHYMPAVSHWAKKRGFSVRQLTFPGCVPFFGDVKRVDKQGKTVIECAEFKDKVYQLLQSKKDEVDTVVLGGRWAIYTETNKGIEDNDNNIYLIDSKNNTRSKENSRRVFAEGLRRTIEMIEKLGMKVVILGQVPLSKSPDCVLKSSLPIQKILPIYNEDCRVMERQYIDERTAYANRLFEQMSLADHSVVYFSPLPHFCSTQQCFLSKEHAILYRDFQHLNHAGGEYIGQFMEF